jgi:hypothetical protein
MEKYMLCSKTRVYVAFQLLCCLLKTGHFAANYLIKLRKPVCNAPKAEIKMERFSPVSTEETGKIKKNIVLIFL